MWLGYPALTTQPHATLDTFVSCAFLDQAMVMPGDGYVTEWKWYGESESMIRLQVLRDFGEVDSYPNWNQVGHNYTLVGEVGWSDASGGPGE